jgi:hypothetical protein
MEVVMNAPRIVLGRSAPRAARLRRFLPRAVPSLAAAMLLPLSAVAEPVEVRPSAAPQIADEPGALPVVTTRCSSHLCPMPAVIAPLPPRPRRELHVSLSAMSGVATFGSFMGVAGNAGALPYLGGDLQLTWRRPGSVLGLGLRLGAYGTFSANGSWGGGWFEQPAPTEVRMLGFDAGFLLSASWFWFSAGAGAMHVRRLTPLAKEYHDSRDETSSTLPDVNVAVGLDIPLGKHLALRLYGSAATLLFWARANAGGGLVVRF